MITADDDRPLFGEKLAATDVGKRLLVGMTYLDANGQLIRREQFCQVLDHEALLKKLCLPAGR